MTQQPGELDQLATEYWETHLADHPSDGHLLGRTEFAARYESATRAHEDDRIAALRAYAERATALEGLDADQEVTRQVIISDATTRADLAETRLEELSADPVFGMQSIAPVVFGMFNVPDADVADAMVEKLAGLGRWFGEVAERHREGVASGRVPAEFAVTETISQIDTYLLSPLDGDAIVASIKAPDGVDSPAWRQRLTDAVEQHVRPGMASYRDILRDDVLLQARPDDRCGLTGLDDGDEAYARALRFFTTTELSAKEIHELGLAQVEQLAEEYRTLGASALGTGDLGEIFARMRTDPALHFETGEQLVEASETAMAKAWAAMGDWFEVLPQAPCVVEGTRTGAKAFYFPPAADGSRGGTFFINIADPTSWGRFELEAMAFHEGIPGHHLQLAVASELPDSVPLIRKHAETAAYAEGWGLYTERLADEMGLYSTDIDRLGMLSADSMRACRLVVDTGLHALGWSRQQAVDYMLANSPLTEGVVRPEIDRYVVYPGQATSYMVGRLEILRMRREAQERQGAAFDVRKFHSAVLDSGTLPLGVLDGVVRRRLP